MVDGSMGADDKKLQTYLAEIILTIQNEVQSAVDFISEVATKEETELGKSSVVMTIESLRLKLPIRASVEQQEEEKETVAPTKTPGAPDLRRNLAARKGFVVDRSPIGKSKVYSKIAVSVGPQIGAEKKGAETGGEKKPEEAQMGEIEIKFFPLKRENK